MTREQIVWAAAILTTLADCDGSPAGTIYTAMGMDMQKWEVMRDILVGSDMIKVSAGHFVTIRPNGRALAAEITQSGAMA